MATWYSFSVLNSFFLQRAESDAYQSKRMVSDGSNQEEESTKSEAYQSMGTDSDKSAQDTQCKYKF